MSIKIGINGTTSFNALKDLIVGTSDKTKQDVNKVIDWNGTIIWQRKAPDVPMTQDNTVITINPTSYNESGSSASWGPYTPSVTKVTVNGVEIGTDKYQIDGYSNNSGIGTVSGQKGKVTISGKNGYSGSVYKEFSISYTQIIDISGGVASGKNVSLADRSSSYTPTKNEIVDGLSVWVNGQFLTSSDYDADCAPPTFDHNESEGQLSTHVTITLTGKGKYTGSLSTLRLIYHSYINSQKRIFISKPKRQTSIGIDDFIMIDVDNHNYVGSFQLSDSYYGYPSCSCYGNGMTLVFFDGTSSTNGGSVLKTVYTNDWEKISSMPGGYYVMSCCFTGTRFVATVNSKTEDKGYIIYSSDGRTWNTSSWDLANTTCFEHNIMYRHTTVSDTICATTKDGHLVVSSDDGTTFTSYTPSGLVSSHICCDNIGYRFLLLGTNGKLYTSTNTILTSVSEVTTPLEIATHTESICFANGKFWLKALSDVYSSANFTTWTEEQDIDSNNGNMLSVDNVAWCIVSAYGKLDHRVSVYYYNGSLFARISNSPQKSSVGWDATMLSTYNGQ